MKPHPPELSEANRPWWEKMAATTLVPRRVAAFLLGRSPTWVTALNRAMGNSNRNPINIRTARQWILKNPDFRSHRQSGQSRPEDRAPSGAGKRGER